jgi:hypothetical protein
LKNVMHYSAFLPWFGQTGSENACVFSLCKHRVVTQLYIQHPAKIAFLQ